MSNTRYTHAESDARPAERRYQVLVIGAGQAGLAVGHFLVEAGIDVLILEAEARVGESWRRRWDSLRLFTAAEFAQLPGLPFPGDQNAFPTKDEMAEYLEEYARHMHLPIRFGTRVDAVEGTPDGYVVTAGGARFEADQIVVTTGPYQLARVPSWARDLDDSIVQIHSNVYKNAKQLPAGDILVVGAGNTGAELALEAARAGHRVLLSGRDVGQVPRFLRRWNGRIFWFLATRVLTNRNPIGRKIRAGMRAGHSSPLVRIRKREIPEAGIERVARIVGVRDGKPLLGDGRTPDVACVLWCGGFTMDFSWIHLPIFSEDGYPIHEDGRAVTAPGLYFVGLPFQRSLSSASLVGVGRDAALVAEWITKAIEGTTDARQPVLAVAQ